MAGENNQPSPEPKETVLPAPSAIPAGYVLQAEVYAAADKARTEERTKLHGEIDSLKKTITEKDTEISSLGAKITELTGQVSALAEAKTTDGKIDIEKLLERNTETVTKLLRKESDAETAKLTQRLSELEAENNQTKVERLRSQLIAANGGEEEMIVELVTGTTEEEITASIERAKTVYETKVKGKVKRPASNEEEEDEEKGAGTGSSKKNVTKNPPPEISSKKETSGGRGSELKTVPRVKEMSRTEYAGNREGVLDELRKNYSPRAGARPFTGANRARGRNG